MTTSELLSEIRAFLAETGMSGSYFGRIATGNSELVARLEAGKDVTLSTAEAVRTFIAERRELRSKANTSGSSQDHRVNDGPSSVESA